MKTSIKTALLSAALLLGACTDLSEEVYSDIQKKDFFTSEESLRIYAARAYNMLQAYGSEQSLWTLNIQTGDELAAPKNCVNDWVDPRYAELQRHTYTPSNKLVRMGWDYCFDGIAACNDVLHEIENNSLEFDGKAKILAEVRILRDYFYMLAIDGWGNVPFSVDASDKNYPEQKDRKFVFSFIEKEILDNIGALEEVPSAANYGHVTQGMAYTLLAKMYLNAEKWIGTAKWAEAEQACLAVMNPGHYRIEPDYSSNFAVHNEASRENIFVIPYSTVYTQSDHNDFVIFILTLNQQLCKLYNIPAAGWDGFIAQPDFFASYDEADTRRAKTWLYGEFSGSDGPFTIVPEVPEEAYANGRTLNTGAPVGKWEYQTDGLLKSDQTSMDNDFAVFRYADVVLMYAEACMRQNKAADAVAHADLQAIRTRAGLAPFTAATLTEENLLAERGHELAIEGWRRQDLIRFGKYNGTWWCKPSASPAYTELYPIPRERLGANPNLKQNPGYTK